MSSLKEDLLALKKRLESIEGQLEGQMKELEVREGKWKSLEEQLNTLLQQEKGEIVTFDVGGKKFSTYKETILAKKDTLFYKMIQSGNFNFNEEIYFDRSPKHFHTILGFIRNGKINYSQYKKDDFEELLNEADYYEISEISSYIEELKKDVEFIKMEYSGPYVYNGQTAGNGTAKDLMNRNLNTGVCATSPGWIILELNAGWEFDEIEVGGWTGNSTLWYNANGAGAQIQTSMDKTTWKTVGTIPSNYGSSIQNVKVTKSTGKYVKFNHNSYLGLGFVGIKKKNKL